MAENKTNEVDMEAVLKEIAIKIEALELAFTAVLQLAAESIHYASEKNESVAMMVDYAMKRIKSKPIVSGGEIPKVLLRIKTLLRELDKYEKTKH